MSDPTQNSTPEEQTEEVNSDTVPTESVPQPEEVNSNTVPPESVPQPVADDPAGQPPQEYTTEQKLRPEEAGGKSYEDVAKEILAGQWGRGHRREERLELAGYNRGAVQEALRQLLNTEEYEGVENRGLQNTQAENG